MSLVIECFVQAVVCWPCSMQATILHNYFQALLADMEEHQTGAAAYLTTSGPPLQGFPQSAGTGRAAAAATAE